MNKQVNDLKARVGDLKRQLREAEARLHAAECDAAGVVTGDIVVSKGQEFLVRRVTPWAGNDAWVSGSPKRKDGTFGSAIRNLYGDWKKVAGKPEGTDIGTPTP